MNWDSVKQKHAGLSMREKLLALVSALVLIIFTAINFVIEPIFVEYSDLKKTQLSAQESINTTKLEIKGIETKLASKPLEEIKNQLAALNVQHQQQVDKLEKYELSLVSSDEMAELVEEIVSENEKLALESFISKEPIAILLQATEGDDKVLLYRHSIAITMKGEYFSLLDFMKKIEKEEQSVLWGEVDYRVDEYPNAIISFEIYTISTDKEFIGVKN